MKSQVVIEHITHKAHEILPKGARLLLNGSRARGDNRPDRDWDLLILILGDRVTFEQDTKYAFPFQELGWDIGEEINPQIFTLNNWKARQGRSLYVYEVERDGIELWH